GDLLALLFLNPDHEYSITSVAEHVSASVKAVQQEVDRLVRAGLLSDRRLGTSRLIRSVQDSLLTRPLTDLLAVTYGPLPVLTDALAGLDGVDEACIYGSWASRYRCEAGSVSVDVLVVAITYADEVDDRARAAVVVLRREVNIRTVRPGTWETNDDPFIRTVRSRPMVKLAVDGVTAERYERT